MLNLSRPKIDLTKLRPTSKLSLKLTCLSACGNDIGAARELERVLHDFVDGQYRKGALVTAGKVSEAVRRFGGGFLVSDFLKR